MDQNFDITRITFEDIEQIIWLQRLCYKEKLREDREVFELLLSIFPEGANKIFNDHVIGYIFFHPYIFNKIKPLNQPVVLSGNDDCMHLQDLSIHPSFRGMGVSKLLLDPFNSETKLRGFKYQTLIAVQGSEKMWSKIGFQIKEIISYGNEIAYYMSKSLL